MGFLFFFFASVFALLLFFFYTRWYPISPCYYSPPGHLMMYGGEPTEYFCECVRYMCVCCVHGGLSSHGVFITPPVKRKSHPRGATGGTLQHSTCVCVCVVYLLYTFFFFSHTLLIYFLPLAITRMSDAGALLSERKKYTNILYLYFSLDGVCVARWERNYEMNMR
jgi:hypothetical protein